MSALRDQSDDNVSTASVESVDGPPKLTLTYSQHEGSADGGDGVCQVIQLPSNQEIINRIISRCSINGSGHMSMHLSLLTLPGETMDSAINRYNQSSSDNPDFLKFTTATHRDYSLWEEVAKDHPLVHKDTQKPNGETCDVGIIAVVPLLTLSSFGDEICGSMIGDVTDPTSIQVASKSTATEEFVRLWRLKGAAPNVELQLYDVQPLPPLSDTNLEQRSHGFASPGSTTQEQDADELSRPPACDAASGLSDHTHDTLEKTSTQTWMSEHAFQAGYTPLAGVRFGGEEYSLRGPIPYDKDTWVCSPPRVFFRLTIGAEEWREAVPVQRDDGQLLMWMVERVACSGGMSLFWPAFLPTAHYLVSTSVAGDVQRHIPSRSVLSGTYQPSQALKYRPRSTSVGIFRFTDEAISRHMSGTVTPPFERAKATWKPSFRSRIKGALTLAHLLFRQVLRMPRSSRTQEHRYNAKNMSPYAAVIERRGRLPSRSVRPRSDRQPLVTITQEDHTAADVIVSSYFSDPLPPSDDPYIQALYAEHFPEEGRLYDFHPAPTGLDTHFALRDVSARTRSHIYPVCPTKMFPASDTRRTENLQGSNFLLGTSSDSGSEMALFDLKILPEFSSIGWDQFGDGLERFAEFPAVKRGDPGSLAIVLEPFQSHDQRSMTLAEAFMSADPTTGKRYMQTVRDSGSLKSVKTASLGSAFVNVVYGPGDGRGNKAITPGAEKQERQREMRTDAKVAGWPVASNGTIQLHSDDSGRCSPRTRAHITVASESLSDARQLSLGRQGGESPTLSINDDVCLAYQRLKGETVTPYGFDMCKV
ncbi:uncharacterized protein MKK02DRAFT_31109 [Dioszegia hungarica]|uniref:Uncharacterized protein n=1 Tax=Dioszegia hungarica TaxID=4972 RepID=A0AA38LWV8_9TREE|nr:uncharacterized protein MKK02DRAFT_31109 [Dioszegia hungarica]KAI9638790.1 hypothetical protein MKK02DRAFT_31109 [Dioszegia hungarica]